MPVDHEVIDVEQFHESLQWHSFDGFREENRKLKAENESTLFQFRPILFKLKRVI